MRTPKQYIRKYEVKTYVITKLRKDGKYRKMCKCKEKTQAKMIQDVIDNGGEYTFKVVNDHIQDVHYRKIDD